MQPLLDQLNLIVRDMDETLAFYRALGLDIPEESVWRTDSGAHHVEIHMANGFSLSFDSAMLATAYNQGWREPYEPASRSVINLRLESRQRVDDICQTMSALGHEVSQPPTDAFWGARYAVVIDPDGNNVGLMSAPEAERRSAPPDI